MRIFITVFLLSLVAALPARACDLNNLSIGAKTNQIVDQYNLEVFEIDTEGEVLVPEMGKVVCSGLPEQSLMEFIFIDDTFVKLKITNESTADELLLFAQKTFGENDDADRKQNSDGKVSVALWNSSSKMSVLYSMKPGSPGQYIESIDISSKLHSNLFEKIVEQRSKEIDEYFKANKLGEYAESATGGSSSSTTTTSDDNNKETLEEMKERYEREQQQWKKQNEENKLGR